MLLIANRICCLSIGPSGIVITISERMTNIASTFTRPCFRIDQLLAAIQLGHRPLGRSKVHTYIRDHRGWKLLFSFNPATRLSASVSTFFIYFNYIPL
jgi:hypothetical protein